MKIREKKIVKTYDCENHVGQIELVQGSNVFGAQLSLRSKFCLAQMRMAQISLGLKFENHVLQIELVQQIGNEIKSFGLRNIFTAASNPLLTIRSKDVKSHMHTLYKKNNEN